MLQVNQLPNGIDAVDKDICDKVIICEKTWRPYKILATEFAFYKQYGLPLPSTHYKERDTKRCEKLPTRFLTLHTCDNCSKEGISEYRKEHKYKVYCEACYKREVYG